MILVQILLLALFAILAARFTTDPWRGRLMNLAKAFATVLAFWVLFTHQVTDETGEKVAVIDLIVESMSQIEAGTFVLFCAAAAGTKFLGILASMQRWRLLIQGQNIELPFRHIFGSFLIGRFIGTFLPSTAGLDGYTLYDAARFSGRTVEVTAAKFLEKIIGLTGVFMTFLVALPFGMPMFYSIFEERSTAQAVAGMGVSVSMVVLGGLVTVLWFPGVVQWVIQRLPLPGKERLVGIVKRISESTAAYRHKKGLVLQAFFLSFLVHFTTAVMYYFTALAIKAPGAELWTITLGSSIQILATVLSPFTIAGEGIRELAQLLLLGNLIGPAAAVVSAALGFWAAEALTLAGAWFWWVRPADYTPPWCLVNGEQVDYAAAAEAATALETHEERTAREAKGTVDAPPYPARARLAAGYGLGAGILAGIVLGIGEAIAIGFQGFGTEAQVLWSGPFAYAAIFGGACLLGGLVLAAFPMDDSDSRAWTPSLAILFTLIPVGLAVTVFRLRRDVYLEQMPPIDVLLLVVGGFGLLALALFFIGPRIFRGFVGNLARPGIAIGLLLAVMGAGALAGGFVPTSPLMKTTPEPVAAALADRPNLILIMVDTLRADHLSCYGGSWVETPNLCRVATDGGTIYDGFAHASWTKPSTASLLTSLIPSSHQTMSKPSALPDEITTVAEALQSNGYATGAYVSNTNLTESFGFAQGFDEYHYLGPDYLFGARESASKLVLYQIVRRVYFSAAGGKRFGDFYQDSQVVNANAFGWLDRHRDSRFFLFLHYMDVHDPYFAHPYDGTGFDRASNQEPDPALAEEMHALYNGEIAYLDAEFGKLVAKIEGLGLWQDSVVVLVADHGEEFGEHGGFWHGLTLYEEQIRIPMLVKWPKNATLAPAEMRGVPARLIDVAPTLLARAGARVPAEMQGLDLAGDLARRNERDRMVFSEEDHEGNVIRSIRTARWKWIEAEAGNPRGLPEEELFDVSADPGEISNLAEREPGTAGELARHADAMALSATKVGIAAEAEISCDEYAGLVALGYVEAGGRPDCGS